MVTEGAAQLTPAQAWATLARGNERFVSGEAEPPNQDPARGADTAGGKQTPFAVVFGCNREGQKPTRFKAQLPQLQFIVLAVSGGACDP